MRLFADVGGFNVLGDYFWLWVCGVPIVAFWHLWLLGTLHYRWQRRRWPWGPRKP